MNLVETLSKVSCDGGGQLSSCKALKARLQLPESDLCTALGHLVFQVGVLGGCLLQVFNVGLDEVID